MYWDICKINKKIGICYKINYKDWFRKLKFKDKIAFNVGNSCVDIIEITNNRYVNR